MGWPNLIPPWQVVGRESPSILPCKQCLTCCISRHKNGELRAHSRRINLRVFEGRAGGAGPEAAWRGHYKWARGVTTQWIPGAIRCPPQNAPPPQFISSGHVLCFCFLPLSPYLSTPPSWSLSGSLVAEPLPWLFQYPAGEPLSFQVPLFLPAPWAYCIGF